LKNTPNIRIVPYSEEYKDEIKYLNYEWLQHYFKVEKGDAVALSNPKEEIIDKGGFIFFVLLNDQVVGTASLLKKTNVLFELGKMAVSKTMQGKGIGENLLKHCLHFAKNKEIKSLILYSNTKLKPALKLYHKYGFKEVTLEPGLYERANIKMELILRTTLHDEL